MFFNFEKIKFLLPLQHQGEYSLFIPRRIEFICKDIKYYNCHVSIIKCDWMEKRYILKIDIFLKGDKIDEIYEGITSGNVLYMNVKDILIFMLHGSNINYTRHQIQMRHIKNDECNQYVLTKEYKIQPFHYQLENIQWCKTVENNINTKSSCIILNGYDDKLKLDNY